MFINVSAKQERRRRFSKPCPSVHLCGFWRSVESPDPLRCAAVAFVRRAPSPNGWKRNVFSPLWAHSSPKGFSRDRTVESSLPIWLIIVDVFSGGTVISVVVLAPLVTMVRADVWQGVMD